LREELDRTDCARKKRESWSTFLFFWGGSFGNLLSLFNTPLLVSINTSLKQSVGFDKSFILINMGTFSSSNNG